MSATRDEAIQSTYHNCYELNDNWQSSCSAEEVTEELKKRYGFYYAGKQINYGILRSALIAGRQRAKELFKALFYMPEKLKPCAPLPASLEIIERNYGNGILAHGVEESKGGMCNLLMMCISNEVRVPASYWGCFKYSMPNGSPLSHGPYFVIAENPRQSKSNLKLDYVKYFLVPFQENINILKEKSAQLLSLELINRAQHERFCAKLITYDDLLMRLQAGYLESEEMNVNNHPVISLDVEPIRFVASPRQSASSKAKELLDESSEQPAPSIAGSPLRKRKQRLDTSPSKASLRHPTRPNGLFNPAPTKRPRKLWFNENAEDAPQEISEKISPSIQNSLSSKQG